MLSAIKEYSQEVLDAKKRELNSLKDNNMFNWVGDHGQDSVGGWERGSRQGQDRVGGGRGGRGGGGGAMKMEHFVEFFNFFVSLRSAREKRYLSDILD